MWKNITINENQIETMTERSALIKVPGTDWKFWHPMKCLRSNGNQYSLGYTDDFTFRLFKNGNGHHNKFEKVAEKEVGADEIEEYFAGNITSSANNSKDNRLPITEIIEPTYRQPEHTEVDDELKF